LLTGGTRATLHFWQNYDFGGGDSLITETGQIQIRTGSQASPIPLDELSDAVSDGWEEAEYDLTPYIGSVVQLIWEYTLLDFEQDELKGLVGLRELGVHITKLDPKQ
jgi:hypothetical protein